MKRTIAQPCNDRVLKRRKIQTIVEPDLRYNLDFNSLTLEVLLRPALGL